jgi:hypothetical protein
LFAHFNASLEGCVVKGLAFSTGVTAETLIGVVEAR